MRFRVEQRFAATADAVLALYLDPAFYASMHGLSKIDRPEVLDRTDGPDERTVTMRVRYRFIADLPGAALAVIDPAKLTWVEEAVYDLDALTATTRLLPDHYPDRLTASGTVAFTADPFDDARSRRVLEGDVQVRMPFVGGQVERAIISGLREHLADEEAVAATLLAPDR